MPLHFKWVTKNINNNITSVPLDGCSDVMFVNPNSETNETAYINNMPLPANGSSVTFSAFGNEVQKSLFNIRFETTNNALHNLIMWQKIYVNE